MIKLRIGEIELVSDYGSLFNEKVSVLRKLKSFSISSSLYLNNESSYNELLELKYMKSIPETIYTQKGGCYFWVFGGCKLISLTIQKDNDYYTSWMASETEEKWEINIEIGYDEVFGTSNPDVVKREIALNNLFSRE